ncbi:MAG: YdcF family protein [Anaerolineae bacterium]|nr:YdcF family protein [Anaerolineae bacterium]
MTELIQPVTNRTRFKQFIKRGFYISVGVLSILAAWTAWTFTGRFAGNIYGQGDLKTIPEKPVAIVFGAGYWPNGTLSPMLQDRMDAAMELYHAGQVSKLLLSGDNRFVTYDEPTQMLKYALEQGIPRGDMVLDYAGRRTYDTCYRARAIFQVDEVVLVTQRYHLPRALETCRGVGVNSIGYVADRQPYPRRSMARYITREVLAMWQSWWDVYIWRPTPVLGDPLPIFQE